MLERREGEDQDHPDPPIQVSVVHLPQPPVVVLQTIVGSLVLHVEHSHMEQQLSMGGYIAVDGALQPLEYTRLTLAHYQTAEYSHCKSPTCQSKSAYSLFPYSWCFLLNVLIRLSSLACKSGKWVVSRGAESKLS